MSTSAALADKYAHIERDIVRALKSTLQKVPVEISAYATADFEEVTAKPQTERGAKGLRKAKSGLLYWNTTNPTSNLRRQTGNLIRALQVGGKGNVSNTEYDTGSKSFVIEFSFDESTAVSNGPQQTTLRYGAIHEEGDRPFLAPAMKSYQKTGFPKAIKRLISELNEILAG